jgi:Zn-dependent M16 (insulinase) family peptidase
MKKRVTILGLLLFFLIAVIVPVWAKADLESFKEGQKIHGFTVTNVYENGSGKAIGARFISDRFGFIIDLIEIQSVPQAFYWIKTPPTSSMGEPHACEHLLLGKGNRGRRVAALEDMALGNSTAGTGQIRTCYHFNTTAGEETFYEIFEAKLEALLHPDFTDEEIQREVCHLGVVVDQQDSTLAIEEKGTVYTEMVSSFEKPWYYFDQPKNVMVYGDNHPLSYISGGDPTAMRNMVPEDMWRFHKNTYHLANMGAIVAIPDDISIDSFLKRMTEILNQCQSYPDSSFQVGIGAYQFPPIDMAPPGTIEITSYPSENPTDPGYVMYAWPADLELEFTEKFMLELFLEAFASEETSNLYDLFINSQTRKVDFGGNYIYSGLDSELGNSIYLGFVGIDNGYINDMMVDSIRTLIIDEMDRVYDFENGSGELAEFNERVKSRLIQERKQIDHYLNSPPMFGFRSGPSWGWLQLLEDLEEEEGFRKSLVMKNRFAYAESLLSLDDNFWKERIDRWRILTVQPYAVGTFPDPELLARETEAKRERIAGYIEDLKKKYRADDPQEAIAKYKDEFDEKTAELEAIASKDVLPTFIDNPPMTLDDQLKYEIFTLPGGIPLVASTFENMTSSEIGIALRLDVIPESLLVYLPYLPSVMTDIGVIKGGQVVRYDEMVERLRNEVLNLDAYFDHSDQTNRIEIILVGSGNNLEELENVLGWMDAALYSPYLSTDNLPRMMDLIDQTLISYRNMMKGSEEGWVEYPAKGYRYQRNPLYMSTGCFLTEAFHYQRLKWLLTDPGNNEEQKEFAGFMKALTEYGEGKNRTELVLLLTAIEHLDESPHPPLITSFKPNILDFSVVSKKNVKEIAQALKITLADIPDANLAKDWAYLCNQTEADMMAKPEDTISRFNAILDLIRKTDNARMFMISNSTDRKATFDMIEKLVAKLDSDSPSIRQNYGSIDRITQRLKSRHPDIKKPIYVGLLHEGTRNGVLIFSAKHAAIYDTSTIKVLDCLSGKLYGGYGPHGLFMKTWGAGLAYSNGYRYNESTGRVRYYAERCPDVSQTMRFVVGQLKNAKPTSDLTDYAIAQVFGDSRAPSGYEERGEEMAANLADGITPQIVRTFRQKVLAQRDRKDLYRELESRMEAVYGSVLIGFGPPLTESEDGISFLIGPESQFEFLENYIEAAEGKQTVYRLYPRDFWLIL